jgi:hypothetical protein
VSMPTQPARTLELSYARESHYGLHILARLYDEGWETLGPLRYYACCGHYCTILYLPDENIIDAAEAQP